MRRKLVVGNWKMHGTLAKNQALMTALVALTRDMKGADFALCVPYPYLFQAQSLLSGSTIAWGAQNISKYDEGAYTASISAEMVADFGATFAIIGHSERRAASHESNESAAARFAQAVRAGITPIFCVGETAAERNAGLAEMIVKNQMRAILKLGPEILRLAKQQKAVIAYEPVWAIGASKTAAPSEAEHMHALIRESVAEFDAGFAEEIRILYGGSVTPENAADLFAMPGVDGGLIGRASLDANAFSKICETACYPMHAQASKLLSLLRV